MILVNWLQEQVAPDLAIQLNRGATGTNHRDMWANVFVFIRLRTLLFLY